MQLPLDLVAEDGRAGGEQLGYVRPQFPRMRIDDLKLLFDAHGEPVGHPGIIPEALHSPQAVPPA
jgi:hypothetical protein